MSDQSFPLEPTTIMHRRPSGRFPQSLERLMDEPTHQRKTPVGTDTAWALKLKTCVDTVARELHIEVIGAKPIQCFRAPDSRDMLFEVDTSRGLLEVTRTRSGQHNFNWKTESVYLA